MFLPIVLIVTFLQFPSMPPVHLERFEAEDECSAALVVVANSTRANVVLACLVDES